MTTAVRAPTISVGGPPVGAAGVRLHRAVRGTLPHGPALPGAPLDDRGRPRPTSWTHIAHRGILAAIHTARQDSRDVLVFELGGDWSAWILDGWGQRVDDLTPRGATRDDARAAANRAWTELRQLADLGCGRWERA